MNSYLMRVSMPITVLALLMLLALPVLFAHHPKLETSFTVDERTQVPGKTLEPNMTYVLKVLESDSDRHVVQIFNEDGSRMLTTFLGVSDRASGNQTGFSFMEMSGDHPQVVREWFYPEWGGLKFVYSEREARDITRHSSEGVMWTRNRVNAGMTDLDTIQVTTMEGGRASGSSAEQVARNEGVDLPATAGELPLLGLIGLAFLGAGLTLRFATWRN